MVVTGLVAKNLGINSGPLIYVKSDVAGPPVDIEFTQLGVQNVIDGLECFNTIENVMYIRSGGGWITAALKAISIISGSNLTIQSGSIIPFASPFSYIIFSGSISGFTGPYYALNGTNNKIDYSGTNAVTVIQNSINNISNGKIYIKTGTYPLTNFIDLSGKSNISLIGDGPNETLFTSNGASKIISCVNTNPTRQKEVMLRDFGISAPTITAQCVHIEFTDQFRAENLAIDSANHHAIFLGNGGLGFFLSRIHISNSNRDAIRIQSWSDGQINQCHIHGSAINSLAVLSLLSVGGASVTNCKIADGQNDLIVMSNCTDCTFYGNVCGNPNGSTPTNSYACIKIDTSSLRNNINGNILEDLQNRAKWGININDSSCTDNIIVSNRIYNFLTGPVQNLGTNNLIAGNSQ